MNLPLEKPQSESAAAAEQPACPLPAAPQSLAATGLPESWLVDLAARTLLLRGQLRLNELAHIGKLPAAVVEELLEFMRADKIVALVRRGATHGDVVFALTEFGRKHAAESLRQCRYAGAAPVPLDAYVKQVRRQAAAGMSITRSDIERVYGSVILRGKVRDQIGAAMNSGRPIFFHGPAGSGKTYLAESLVQLQHGPIALPYSFFVDGEVVQVFDPLVHRPFPETAAAAALDSRQRCDRRWILCRRPVVVAGGELRLDMLDLRFERISGFYQAPPQVKANNGLFLIDDFGRQLIAPEQLMNRWIVPMDRHRDYLVLHTGTSFEVPFHATLVFSTNLAPEELADEAFLRRLGYKIHIGPLDEGDYRRVFQQACASLDLPFTAAGADELLELHRRHHRPCLACYPRDLLSLVRDYAIYRETAPQADPEALRFAWDNYFASSGKSPGRPG